MNSAESMLPEEPMQQDIKLDTVSVDEKMHRFCCRSNSNVLIRIITREGRDDPLYCHSKILKAKSTYFEERLSNNLEPPKSFDLYCEESEVDHYTQVLRLCYTDAVKSLDEIRQQTVRNATGILRVAVKLGCQHLVAACVTYLEAVPWDDLDEDEILRTIPKLGPEAASTLARVKPVDLEGLKAVLISALRLATSPSQSITDLKSCVKEKIVYMLSKHHDDAPLLIASDQVKCEVTECTTRLFSRFHDLLDSCYDPDKAAKILLFPSYLSDLSWFFRVVRKLDLMAIVYFIVSWLEVSEKAVKVFRVEKLSEETNLRLIEVAAKVLEPIGKGMIILPTSTRVPALKVWLPFVRWAKPLIDAAGPEAELEPNLESQLWVPLQATFIKLVHSIPSVEQTQILTEWLDGEYPDLTQIPTLQSSKSLNDIEDDASTQSDGSMFTNDSEEDASDGSMSSDEIEEAHEQHRNTKLMNALLRLHKEVSPKLAACAADLSSPYPDSALRFEAVCHLVVSALAYWPVSGWTPGLFHSLLTNVQATSALSLGPKEICSLLCALNDLFPDEGIWLWKNGMPALSALRTLAIGSILGPQKEKEVNWYLKPEHSEKVLGHLRPHLDKIAKMVQHCAISALVVIQDMLRVFIVRIACQKVENASVFIRPILSWVLESFDLSCHSEMDAYKMRRYLDFLASLLEHPQAKALLLKEGIVDILQKLLERCLDAIDSGGSDFVWDNPGFTMYSWCLPVLKSISLICGSEKSEQYSDRYDLQCSGMSSGDCGLILPSLLKCFQVLPFGKELLACVGAFEELGSYAEGRRALLDTFFDVHSKTELHDSDTGQERQQISGHNELRWIRYPPLLCCWKKLWSSFVSRDDDISGSAVEGLKLLSTGCFYFCRDGKSLDLKGVCVVKYLFGLSEDTYTDDGSLEENMNYIKGVATFLSSKVTDHEATATPTFLYQVLKSVQLLLSFLQKSDSDINTVDVSLEAFPSRDSISPKFHMIGDTNSDKADDILLSGGLVDKFLWDCPETLPDKTVLPTKRKLSSVDATGRRGRAENVAADSTRGSVPVAAPPGPTRRDTFRLRKPNTSRPPSMHVDDYVARERNSDGGGDVIAIPRGPTSGRPPSIHVDEFMARQRERQSSSATVVGEAVAPQVKNAAPPLEKVKQLKTEIEDDLQGIDIVFDGEESETDDKLPFLHLDENLQQQQQPAPIENSPRSIVEETESDTHGSGQFSRMGTPTTASNAAPDEISSRMSASRTDRALTREPSVTSDKKFDQPSSGYPGMYNSGRARMSPQTTYPKQSPQYQGNLPYNVAPYDPRFMHTQPPLPPMPPPPSLLSQADSQSNTAMDGQQQQPIPPAFQVQQDYMSAYSNSPIRPLPPLPPTPPPPFLSNNPYNLKAQNMQSAPYGQANAPYPPAPIMPSMTYSNRPQSVPMSSYMTSPMQQQQLNENPLQSHLSGVQTMHQLQPLQPPLLPPQPPHHLHRPLVRQSSDQGFLGQSSSATVQGSSLQMMQPQFAPPPVNTTFYQSQQPESSHAQQSFQQVEPQQQKDAAISLADYFKSPEDIQALLSDREKLCQLLEQHPKLMQMLQEKLGQL